MGKRSVVVSLLPSLAVLAITYLVYVWDRVVVAVDLVEIRKVFGLTLPQGGFLATVFTLGITISAIPAGIAVARFGTKRMLALGAVVFSACTLWSALSPSYGWMVASRIGGGVGEAFFNVALFSFLARSAGANKGLAAGFPATTFGLGIFSGPIVISTLSAATGGWQGPFYVLAAIGGLLAVVIAVVLPSDSPVQRMPQASARPGRRRDLLNAPVAAALCLVAINGVAIYSFIGLFETFLREERQFPLSTAGLLAGLFGLGQLVGGLPMGYVADWLGRKAYLVAASAVTAIVGAVVFGQLSAPIEAAMAFLFGMGTNSIYANCLALGQESVPDDQIPVVTGLLGAVYFLTAAFSGWILASLEIEIGWQVSGCALYTVPFALCALLLVALRRPVKELALTGVEAR